MKHVRELFVTTCTVLPAKPLNPMLYRFFKDKNSRSKVLVKIVKATSQLSKEKKQKWIPRIQLLFHYFSLLIGGEEHVWHFTKWTWVLIQNYRNMYSSVLGDPLRLELPLVRLAAPYNEFDYHQIVSLISPRFRKKKLFFSRWPPCKYFFLNDTLVYWPQTRHTPKTWVYNIHKIIALPSRNLISI